MAARLSTIAAVNRPSVEALLLRGADVLEAQLIRDPDATSAHWCNETMNGLRAISMLSRIWLELEVPELLDRRTCRTEGGRLLSRSIVAAATRLRALIGMSELQIGGLDPVTYPEDSGEEIALGLRLIAWRIVAGIAVLHAFLCLLRRREGRGAPPLLVIV